jgi:hypothetical protein
MDGIMQSWVGSHVDEVINQWGYPSGERNVAGRRLVVWQEDVQLTMPATTNTTGTVNTYGNTAYVQATTNTWGGGTSTWSCARILELNSINVVVGWEYRGNNCPFLEMGKYSKWRRKPS